MKELIVLLSLIVLPITAVAQKPPLEVVTGKTWPSVRDGKISSNGKYILYTIYRQPKGSRTLTLCATDGKWKKEIIGAERPEFTEDGKHVLYKVKDTVCVLTLSTRKLMQMKGIDNFTSAKSNLLCKLTVPSGQVLIRNLNSGRETVLDSVANYFISPSSNKILLESKTDNRVSLKILDLATGKLASVWSGNNAKPGSYAWSSAANQLVWLVEQNQSEKNYELWLWDGNSPARKIPTAQLDGMVVTNRLPQFTQNDGYVTFYVNSGKSVAPKSDAVQVTIWNYQDSVIQNQQARNIRNNPVYAAVLDTHTETLTRIEQVNEKIVDQNGQYVLLERSLGLESLYEAGWNKAAQFSYDLLTIKDGTRKLIKADVSNPFGCPRLSEDGKWIVYYDFERKDFFSYETSSGKIRNMTNRINDWVDENNDYPEPKLRRLLYWLPGSGRVVVHDSYDVWLLDPSGRVAPENLTNDYGRKNGIAFTLDPARVMDRETKDQMLLLSAFNRKNKQSGFYTAQPGRKTDPKEKCMGPYLYERYEDYISAPVKAMQADVYLGLRFSANEFPNYFVTRDFKQFQFFSDVQPQRNYNWYTSELHTWKALDGVELQGILYKPEDFDPAKKYPVIFNYYEQRSHDLNLFIWPSASHDDINIPLFVSNGYLVFVPDIHYTIGEPGRNAYNAVLSAAQYLMQKPWVDGDKMGLQGHSFGGFETDYIIANTNIFSAACSAAGIADQISWYTSSSRANYTFYHADRNQGRMGGTLWEMPEAYLENSPILKAANITTPLLMMHNPGDENVPFQQGVQFFNALRRLGKKAWMLQYDDGYHSVEIGKDAEDYHTRMMQFFDHYLKDRPAPRWMLYGIPAKMKGIDNGLELVEEKDANGKWITPPASGVLTETEKQKVERLINSVNRKERVNK